MNKTPGMFFSTVLLVVCAVAFPAVSEPGKASEKSFSVASLRKIIVLESGRKKPLDSYARNLLLRFSGKQKIHGSQAIEWLARVVFDPQKADRDEIFLINDPEIVYALGIAPRRGRRYSFGELFAARSKLADQYQSAQKNPPKERSEFEKEIVRINEDFIGYGSIASMFNFLSSHGTFHIYDSSLAAQMGFVGEASPSYFELLARSHQLSERMQEIQSKGMDSLTPAETAVITLVKQMYEFSSSIGNPPPHCILISEEGAELWVSPWGLIEKRRSAALIDESMQYILKMKSAYCTGDQKGFDSAAGMFYATMGRNAEKMGVRLPDPAPELFYNGISPFSMAKILLGIAALLALFSVLKPVRLVTATNLLLIIGGWIFVSVGIVLRMIIMGRPPLGNLYEMFIIVVWMTVIFGMILELLRIRFVGIFVASVTGFLFLHIAGRYAADGDTMGTLSAVLNSSFWLTSHIITIALGYAGCVGAGVVGHVYLVLNAVRKNLPSNLESIEKSMYGILCFGCLFTVIGTIFGGLWADQAWGRFWGWDPKENGALLIILWCLTVLHGRLAGVIKGRGTAVGTIIGTVVVMCTWIGTNILGIGLHSYGFTSTGANTLLIYIILESVFIIAAILAGNVRKRTAGP